MITPADIPTIAGNMGHHNPVSAGLHRSATVHCPVCQYDKPTLVIRAKQGGRLQAFCINGCDYKQVWSAVLKASRGNFHYSPPTPATNPTAEADAAERFKKWQKRFDTAIDVADHPIARKYLETRRCVIPPRGSPLRALDGAWHWPTRTTWPAIIALVVNATTLCPATFHLTLLAPDGAGKAPVEPPRLTAAGLPLFGCVVRCTDAGDWVWSDHIGIAEGIESALSLAHLGNLRTDGYDYSRTSYWATVTAGNMATFPVPDIELKPKTITIAVDPDEAGERNALACARRWHAARIRVRLIRPKDGDVNDVIQRSPA